MQVKEIVYTMLGKFCILLGGFGTTVLTAHLWGAEGRGAVAIYVANLGVTAIFSNIFTNSSACYYVARNGVAALWLQALVWTLGVSVLALVFFCGFDTGTSLGLFFLTSVVMGLSTFGLSVFLAHQRLSDYNLLTVAQPVLTFVLILIVYCFCCSTCHAYYVAQLLSSVVILAACFVMLRRHSVSFFPATFSWRSVCDNFFFGFQEELGAFLRFLNYRLPYYFLFYYFGKASVGVFSIGVALGESVFVISRSISLVQYSHMLRPDTSHLRASYLQTLKMGRFSLMLSFGVLVVALLLPQSLYTFVFGPDYHDLKLILLMLTPGVLSVSVSMVYNNFYSAVGSLRILWISGGIGALLALALSFVLIPSYGVVGACCVNSIAQVVCSLVVIFFYVKTQPWRLTGVKK